MKAVVKFLLLFFAMIVSAQSMAQTFGIRAGLNMSNMLMKNDEGTTSEDFKMNPGFHAGPVMEISLNDMFSFETGIMVETKGFRVSQESNEFEYSGKLNLLYADVPITAKAKFTVGEAKIFGMLGPYVGVGLKGKSKYEITFGGETEIETEVVEWGGDPENDDFKRIDLGAVAGAGVEISSIRLSVSYGYGLANITSYTEGGNKVKNRMLSFSAGYMFGNK